MNPNQIRRIADLAGVAVRVLSTGDVSKIEASPQAQLRTARYKKAVHLVGELALKGPYRGDEAALVNNLRFNHAIELLEFALQLPECERGALQWEFLGVAPGERYYLAAPNVGLREKVHFERVNSRIETGVLVVPRGAAVDRVSDLEKTGQLSSKVKLAALQHLYLRFLLDIGDSGTHNILVRRDLAGGGRLIAGGDLEEKRCLHGRNRRLDHLFKKPPSKHQIQLYEPLVCKIKSLASRQLNRDAIDRLSSVGIDFERLNQNGELWEMLL